VEKKVLEAHTGPPKNKVFWGKAYEGGLGGKKGLKPSITMTYLAILAKIGGKTLDKHYILWYGSSVAQYNVVIADELSLLRLC
jgi:hypothetical protein